MSWRGPYWEPRDMWLGLYWTVDVVNRYHADRSRRERGQWRKDRRMNLYICLVPCFPIRVRWWVDR